MNNRQVVAETKDVLRLQCINFDGDDYITKSMAAQFYDIDLRTVDRYLSDAENELRNNGYRLLRGIDLSRFLQEAYRFPNCGLTREQGPLVQLGVFNFRSFLNLGMLLVESNNARLLRKTMLDIVIDFINIRTGGSTKYINQRDKQFLDAYLHDFNYRREFTNAIDMYIEPSKYKYGALTNRVYESIFREKADEYKQVLQLKANDRIRDTLYSEVLNLITAYEHGFAVVLKLASEKMGRKLTYWEALGEFSRFERQPVLEPLINQARSKMASRDLAFRDAMHFKLEEYINPVTAEEIEYFFGKESDEVEKFMSTHREQISGMSDIDVLFEQLLSENEAVLKRLKDRE